MKHLIASVSLLLLAAPFQSAQRQVSFEKPELRGGTDAVPKRPVLHATYDVQLERIRSVRSSSLAEFGVAATCFDNSDIVLEDTYVVANSGEELLNWGVKNCPGASRLRSFTILYLSEAVEVAQGGPGATLSVALFSGTIGFGNPGTEIFRRIFTGLPAAHEVAPIVFLTIDFGTEPLPLPDGRIGWAFLQMDGDTGPVLVRAPKPELGTIDAMDIYSPGPASPGSYVGTFNYNDLGVANTFIQLDEIALNEVAGSVVLNGTGVNPLLLDEIFPARIGHVWLARIDATVPDLRPPPYTVLFVSASPLGPVHTRFGQLLVDPTQWLVPPQLAEGGYSMAIPADTSLIGLRLFLQGAVLPPALPSITLTNALRLRVGY